MALVLAVVRLGAMDFKFYMLWIQCGKLMRIDRCGRKLEGGKFRPYLSLEQENSTGILRIFQFNFPSNFPVYTGLQLYMYRQFIGILYRYNIDRYEFGITNALFTTTCTVVPYLGFDKRNLTENSH